ncbi:chitin synthase-domain-containing protein, partial [Cladochytrium replicatum]
MDIDFLQRDPSRRSRNTLRRKVSQSKSTLSRRSRSLNRPDRAQENLNNNTGTILASSSAAKHRTRKGSSFPGLWTFSSWVLSCCFPTPLLNAVGIRGDGPLQAWREKFALCVIVALMSGFVVFFNLFFQSVLCPDPSTPRAPKGDTFGTLNIRGRLYNTSTAVQPYLATWDPLSRRSPGADISYQFTQPEMPSCAKLSNSFATLRYPCEVNVTCLSLSSLAAGRYGLSMINSSTDYKGQVKNLTSLTPAYSWDVLSNSTILVVRGIIYNLAVYYRQFPDPIPNDRADALLRKASAQLDGTIHFQAASSSLRDSVLSCLTEKYQIGVVDQDPVECITSNVVVLLVYAMVLAVTLIRFVLSVFFSWFIAGRLARDPAKKILESDPYREFKAPVPALRHSTLPTDSDSTVFVEGGGVVAPAYSAVAPQSSGDSLHSPPRKAPSVASLSTISNQPAPAVADSDLYVSLLVTCYSENEESLRATIESLALTEYNNAKKLLFIVADGIITGKGNAKSTPDILIDMLDLDPVIGRDPKPFAYQAVGHDHKKYNMAKVYCGHYVVNDRRVPAVLVVKCGGAAEAESSAKPGNRGKRDSQLVLMNFFNRVMLNEKMTPLDYDMFRKVHHLTGVTPDFYELVLMVDADTYVEPDSLRKMVNCMHNDQRIMGLCGETKIANKRQSWVTAIQVFEYYMSHHLGKAFESTFGGVTCLPGCFCMYRIKARKAGGYTSADWTPILVSPKILEEYCTDDVDTLHHKNLLMLGEDRFLSTLMLRHFPKRRMMFVPSAVCRTVVPERFGTLLSQRRRWINSTVHNLMELVKVNNLCGTFCFSMQFVVFLDLIGTAVFPASLVITYIMIVESAITGYKSVTQFLPTILLICVIFLPAILCVLISRGPVINHFMWMCVYLLSLPIWQIVLPLYSFWHFDDFSWGATRKVDGVDGRGATMVRSGKKEKVMFRKWEEYE